MSIKQNSCLADDAPEQATRMKCLFYLLRFPTVPSLSQEQNFPKIETKRSFVVATRSVLRSIFGFTHNTLRQTHRSSTPNVILHSLELVIHFLFFSHYLSSLCPRC